MSSSFQIEPDSMGEPLEVAAAMSGLTRAQLEELPDPARHTRGGIQGGGACG